MEKIYSLTSSTDRQMQRGVVTRMLDWICMEVAGEMNKINSRVARVGDLTALQY